MRRTVRLSLDRLSAIHLSELPEIWTLTLPRVLILVLGFVIALAAVSMGPLQVAVAILTASWVVGTTIGATRAHSRGGDPRRWLSGRASVADAAVVLVAITVSGGADSPVRWLLLAAPAIWVNARHPRVVVLGALGALGYLAVSIGDVVTGDPDAARAILGFLAIYAGAVLTARATLISFRREARLRAQIETERVEAEQLRLSDARRHQEELVHRLHDGPLQLVLAASQDLEDVSEDDDVELDETLRTLRMASAQMRSLSGGLHDAVLRDAGLAAALQSVAQGVERLGAPPTRVTVGADVAGPHDQLLVSIAGELLTNVHKHARASHSNVVVARGRAGTIQMSVADDGVGLTERDRHRAAESGHIGLVSIVQRVRAHRGSLTIDGAGRGTTITVELPISTTPSADQTGSPS